MTNRNIGWGIVVSLVAAMFIVIIEPAINSEVADNLYGFAGLAWMFFSIYGVIRLFKTE